MRVLAAITTPFTPEEDVDLEAFDAHVRWLVDAGLDGLFVGGTTGEGVLLEEDEVEGLVERAVAAAGPEAVIAQAGRPSTRATVRMAERALAAGAGTVAAYVPWFFPAGDVEVRDHLLALVAAAARADRPAFAYTIPRRHVNALSSAVVGDLARAGLAGMKDSTADLDCHHAYAAAVEGLPFDLFCGTEPLLLEAVRTGAAGAITGLAACAPELLVALRDAVASGDDEAARRAQQAVAEAKEAIEADGETVGSVKRRVRARLAAEGVEYRAEPRAPFR